MKCLVIFNVFIFAIVGQSVLAFKNHKVRFCDDDDWEDCPFNDLSSLEIDTVVEVIRTSGQFSSEVQFPIIRTQEPLKSAWISRERVTRMAYTAVFDDSTNLLSEVLVDLGQRSIVSITPQPSKLPQLMTSEDEMAQQMFLDDERVKVAYERRGLNFSYAKSESWVLGALGAEGHPPGTRLVRLLGMYQSPEDRYHDWHPLEGLEMTVDMNSKSVYSFLDDETVPGPKKLQILEQSTRRHSENRLKPLKISQPEGSSIRVKGQQISWYKWKLMYSMDYIHGLQLFHVRYHGDCEERSVLYKASISEMFVPYGASGSLWRWRNPFDLGEYGLGGLSTPLAVGVDVPENALLFNCTLADDSGTPVDKPACIGVYERDAGILYKHTDLETGTTDGRRSRELVLTFTSAVGNYDYAFDYIFKLDGSMDFKVKLTGIILPRGVSSLRNDATCIESCTNLVNDNLIAPVHQHFFNYRLDFDIDSPVNSVLEVDVVGSKDRNPAEREGFSVEKKLIKTESWRNWKLENSRSWHVVNPGSRNKFGSPRGYALQPSNVASSYLSPRGQSYPQAQFVTHPFWATAYKSDEQGAAGTFPRSGEPRQGLPMYVEDGESLETQDVVIWFTIGVTHVTRPEEWPLMTSHDVSFGIVPVNFMSNNPEVLLKSPVC